MLRLSFWLASVSLSAAASFGRTPWGEPVCRDGVWTEAASEKWRTPSWSALPSTAMPLVQCARSPPCVNTRYMTAERCAAMTDDDDFPGSKLAVGLPVTTSAGLPVTPTSLSSFADAARTALVNRTVVFIGDSVTHQMFEAALCDLRRRGLSVVEATSAAALPLGTPPQALARVQAFHDRVAAVHGWVTEPPRAPWLCAETGLLLGFKWASNYHRLEVAGALSLADAVVVNYGLHYHNNTEYAADMRGLFRQLGAFGTMRGRAAIWRDTGAQHFPGTGAFNSMDQVSLPSSAACVCEAMNASTAALDQVAHINAIAAAAAAVHPVRVGTRCATRNVAQWLADCPGMLPFFARLFTRSISTSSPLACTTATRPRRGVVTKGWGGAGELPWALC